LDLAFPVPVGVSEVTAPSAGVAASDCARAAEKSLPAAAADEDPCDAAGVAPGLDVPEDRALCRPVPEVPPELPDRAEPPLPEGFDAADPGEVEPSFAEPDAAELSAVG
jgi:hypothetical protein